jgi:hypothetical protein
MIHIGAEPTTPVVSTKSAFIPSVFAVVALALWATTASLHLKLSLLIVTPMSTPFGPLRIADYVGLMSGIVFVGLTIFLALKSRHGHNRKRTFSCWAAWAIVVLGTNHFLIYSANEYFHYPQYAILACLLIPVFDREFKGTGMARILFWATALGIVDEMNQYFHLCPQYGDYLDFNDFFLNELGAMGGLLLFFGFREMRLPRSGKRALWRTIEARVIAVTLCVILLLALTGRLKISAPYDLPPMGVQWVEGSPRLFLERKPGMYGGWQKANPSGYYYVVNPLMGIVLLFSVGAAFVLFEERGTEAWIRFFRFRPIAARKGSVRRPATEEGDCCE